MSDEAIKPTMQAALNILMDAVLGALQADPHSWSDRPCPTCRAITGLVGRPFGCYLYQRERTNEGKKGD